MRFRVSLGPQTRAGSRPPILLRRLPNPYRERYPHFAKLFWVVVRHPNSVGESEKRHSYAAPRLTTGPSGGDVEGDARSSESD